MRVSSPLITGLKNMGAQYTLFISLATPLRWFSTLLKCFDALNSVLKTKFLIICSEISSYINIAERTKVGVAHSLAKYKLSSELQVGWHDRQNTARTNWKHSQLFAQTCSTYSQQYLLFLLEYFTVASYEKDYWCQIVTPCSILN